MKNLSIKNNSAIFAASSPKDIILILGCVAIFMSTYPAKAANIGYQPLAVCCTSKVSECSLARIGEGNLSFYTYLSFFAQMPKNEKKTGKLNNSRFTCPPTERNAVSIEVNQGLKNQTIEIVKSWVNPSLPIDDPTICCHINVIAEAQSFIIKHWDFICNSERYAAEIKALVIGLQYAKDQLTEIHQSQNI